MSVIAFQPWNLVNRLQRDLERSFGQPWNDQTDVSDSSAETQPTWLPAVDVRETDEAFVLVADLPGVNPQDIEVTTEKGLLTIRGTRINQDANQVSVSGKGYRRIERVSGAFVRRFTLPETANAEAVTAKSTHGVLTLTIPKRAEVQPRRIEIQAA
jgi:HSP20 family protein